MIGCSAGLVIKLGALSILLGANIRIYLNGRFTPKANGRKSLVDVVTPDKLLPRTARPPLTSGSIGISRSRGEPGKAAMHADGRMLPEGTFPIHTALFPFPVLTTNNAHNASTHVDKHGSAVSQSISPSPQLPAEWRSSGVPRQGWPLASNSGLWVGKGWTCDR